MTTVIHDLSEAEWKELADSFADAVSNRKCIADFYVEPSGFPRRLYVLAAHRGWKRNAGENGLKKKDLYRK